jgi:hypothetical protein
MKLPWCSTAPSSLWSGRCRDWIKIKNIAHPAIERAMLIALSKRRQARVIEG